MVAEENGIEGKSYEELVHDDRMKSLVLKQLRDTGRKAGLAAFELLDGVVLADDEWTPINVSRPCQTLCATTWC